MFRRLFLIAGSLFFAGAMLCLMAEPSQAAQHGGHHGGGGHGGGFHGGGGHGGGGSWHGGGGSWHGGGGHGEGGHHGGGYYGGYRGGYYGYRPFYGSSYGYRPYYGAFYSYPYYGDYGWSSWSSPGYYYSTPSYTVPYQDATPSYSSGYTPETAPTVDLAAHVTVRAPANATVWIGGWETSYSRGVREFDSPPLTPGKRYSYEVKAQWEENGRTVTQTQQIAVSAGATSEAVFPVVTPSSASQSSGTAP